jgi:hypothetical protein
MLPLISCCVSSVFFLAMPADEPTPQQVFERRIMPIFKSPNPSSCVQCHLAGVDLKNYILPSHEKTFLSLRDQGLIDMEQPRNSKILKLIAMKEGGGADLIHAKTKQAEYEAFVAWIEASCKDPQLRSAPKETITDRAGLNKPVEVIRHARKDRLLASFEQNVWAWRFRCMNCHTEGTAENNKHRKEYGERVTWIKSTPEETLTYILSNPRLVDANQPEKSLLLLKPLGEIKHGGGKKFLPGDQGYKGFRAWLEDYAAIKRDRYARAADLPKTDDSLKQFGTNLWFRLANTPPEWNDKLLQVNLYAWDQGKKAWEPTPFATSDRGVNGKDHLWQHTLTLLASKEAARAEEWKKSKPRLPPGPYLVKVWVDQQGKIGQNWQTVLGDEDFAGQAEFAARWRDGYGGMTTVDARQVRK